MEAILVFTEKVRTLRGNDRVGWYRPESSDRSQVVMINGGVNELRASLFPVFLSELHMSELPKMIRIFVVPLTDPMREPTFYRTLVRIQGHRFEDKTFQAVIHTWGDAEVDIPGDYLKGEWAVLALSATAENPVRLLASVNVNAESAADLIFQNWELAPEPREDDGLA